MSCKEMLITYKIGVAANFGLQHRNQRPILHQICHFLPFVKFQLSKIVSCDPPFGKMPKVSDFSCLGNLRQTSLGTVILETKPFSLDGLIKTFIPSEFQ